MSKTSTIVEKYIEIMTKMEWTKTCDFDEINLVFIFNKNYNKFEKHITIKNKPWKMFLKILDVIQVILNKNQIQNFNFHQGYESNMRLLNRKFNLSSFFN